MIRLFTLQIFTQHNSVAIQTSTDVERAYKGKRAFWHQNGCLKPGSTTQVVTHLNVHLPLLVPLVWLPPRPCFLQLVLALVQLPAVAKAGGLQGFCSAPWWPLEPAENRSSYIQLCYFLPGMMETACFATGKCLLAHLQLLRSNVNRSDCLSTLVQYIRSRANQLNQGR